MKHLMESWRRHLKEATSVPSEHMQAFRDTITSSKIWTLPHTEDEIDMGPADELTTPAVESLANSLNDTAEALGTEIYFLFTTVNEEEYALGPDSPYPGYPDNWLMQGAYQGPQKGKHVVWFQFRPLSEDFEMDKFNPEALVKVLSQTLNHELVHYYQLKKQAANKGISDEEAWAELEKDPKQLPQDGEEQTYLGLHNEIDAYAHEAAEQLLDKHSPEEALDIIRKLSADNLEKYPEISSVVKRYVEVFKDDPKTLDKFRKKLVQQIESQSGMQEIFNNWRGYLKEMIKLDIEVGDVILGGKYKNKRMVVKDIGEDELGQPTVNGKPILKFRIEKFLPDEKKSKKTLDAEKEEEGETES